MQYIILLLLLIMSAGCATAMPIDRDIDSIKVGVVQPVLNSSEPPNWILGKEHSGFSNARYLVGIGFSNKNTVSASESARAELAKNIRFKIASVMKDYNSNDGSFVESFIQTETDALLEGVQIKDGWFDPVKKVYYSYAVVKRKDVLATIQDQIDSVIAMISLTMNQADIFYENNKILKSLVYYYDGYNESSKLLPLLRTYKSVSLFPEVPPVATDIPSAIDFKKKVQSIVGNIEIEKVKDNHIFDGNDASFVVKITYNNKALKNLPIKFHGNSYGFISRAISDNNGFCKVKTASSNILDNNNFAIVKAEVDLHSLSRRFNHRLRKDLFGRLETLDVTFKEFKDIKFTFEVNKATVELGDNVVFFVESDVSGYLAITTRKHGKHLENKLFPNYLMRDNYIEKHKVYNIGGVGYEFKFLVQKPVGREFITATLYKDQELTHLLGETTITYNIVETILPPFVKGE